MRPHSLTPSLCIASHKLPNGSGFTFPASQAVTVDSSGVSSTVRRANWRKGGIFRNRQKAVQIHCAFLLSFLTVGNANQSIRRQVNGLILRIENSPSAATRKALSKRRGSFADTRPILIAG